MSFHYNSNAIVLLDYKEFLFFVFFFSYWLLFCFFKVSVHSQIVIDACSQLVSTSFCVSVLDNLSDGLPLVNLCTNFTM